MSNNNTSEGVVGGVDIKFIMQALTSKVQRIFMAELEQFHERVEQIFEHPQNPPIGSRRDRLPRRGAQVEEEKYDEGDLRMRMVRIRLLVIGGMGGDIEKIGIGKIIIWETLR